MRAKIKWNNAKIKARDLIGQLSERDRVILMIGLYWGEGSKGSFSFINGDPYLVKSYLEGLIALGVQKTEIRLNFRIFSDMNKEEISEFWLDFLGLEKYQIGWFEVVKSTGKKKLVHGMCRIHIIKGESRFKLIMSMIDFIKSESSCRSSMDRTRVS